MTAGAKVGLLLATVAAAVIVLVVAMLGDEQESNPPAAIAPAPDAAPKAPPRSRRAPTASASAPSSGADELDELDAKTATKRATDFRLTGRVVDADDKPVAGAVVRALRADGAPTTETKSDAEGLFVVSCGRRPRSGAVALGVTAVAGPTGAAYIAYDLMEAAGEEDDLGDLQIEPAVRLTARIVDARGPVAGASVYVGTFFGTVFAAATADEHGVAKFDVTPATDSWLYAYAAGRGRARGEVPDGRDPAVPLILKLTGRSLRITVVDVPGDVPIVDDEIAARIATDADGSRLFSAFVPPVTIQRTGADGATRIDDVAMDDAVEVRRLASTDVPVSAWRGPRRLTQPVVAASGAKEVRIEIPAGRAIRWRIVAGDVPAPRDGSLVKLRGTIGHAAPRGPSALKVDGADLLGIGFLDGPFEATAEAGDGSIAMISAANGVDRGPDVAFLRPRRVEVCVRETDGAPIVGAEVSLKTEADAVVAELVPTDEKGLARFDGLASNPARVAVSVRSSPPVDERRVGIVDVSRGDGRVDVRLPRARELVLRVTTDGERKLPPQWKVILDQVWQEGAIVDEAAAEIRVGARPRTPDAPLRLLFRAGGFRDVELDVSAATSTVDVAVDHGVTVYARVRMRDGPVRGVLQRWSEDQRWTERTFGGQIAQRAADPDGRRVFAGLPPGKWRLCDPLSRTATAGVDVALGDDPPTLVLDLMRSGHVTGRILTLDDKPVENAWVEIVDPPGADIHVAGVGINTRAAKDGSFTVGVPGDRSVRLRARYHLLRADPEFGTVDVVEPRDGVILRLVEGPVLRISVPEQRDKWFRGGWQVHLYRGAADGEPAATLVAMPTDAKHWSACGFEPGRYTVWVDWTIGAPTTFQGVDLSDGVTDVGEIRYDRGSSVVVRTAPAPEGQAAPALVVTITRVDAPKYSRSVGGLGSSDVVVSGLGPGRFEVRVAEGDLRRQQDPRSWRLVRVVDLDGVRDVVVDTSTK